MNSKQNDFQGAINVIAEALEKAARGCESPPDVTFDISWIDISTYEGRAWLPRITFSATAIHTIELSEL